VSMLFRYVSGSRPSIVSSLDESGLISGTRIQKRSLIHLRSVSRFGSVSAVVYWQGLDALFIVELFVRPTFHVRARNWSFPAGLCRHSQTPDASLR